MSEIKPIDLPSAAGVEYGRGDVRHFAEDDAVDVPSLQNPTRHLAERDNLLATKVNEIVEVVNNKEQFVPLNIPRTSVPPGTEEIVANFKIPAGYEARVLNAAIGSTPASSALSLKIYYATGYGNTTGTELVSTTSTFSAGVAFYNDGEFIVSIRNSSSVVLDAAVSITLTVRPIGSTASLLVGSVIRGDKGLPGRDGGRGEKGDPGPGGSGTPGMIWSGAFNSANSYNAPQVVSFTSGGITTSYIAKIANPAPSVSPPNSTYWDVVASGSSGSAGQGLTWRGPWAALTPYVVNDAVSYTTAGVTTSYICTTNVTSATPPDSDTANWDVLVTPGGETPTYETKLLVGTGGGTPVPPYFALEATYTGGANDGDYIGGGVAGSNVSATAREVRVVNTNGTFAMLHAQRRGVFTGTVTAYLPQIADGATFNWSTASVHCLTSIDSGSVALGVNAAKVTATGGDAYTIVVNTADPVKVTVTLMGMDSGA